MRAAKEAAMALSAQDVCTDSRDEANESEITDAEGAERASLDFPDSMKKIVGAFQMVPDPMARYKQLLFFAGKLDPLEDEYKTPENKVVGCVSQVWVRPELRDGLVFFKADSDSQLTKGLAALLCNGLSGCEPRQILALEPSFIEMLGLNQSLTPSRNNGFLNMFKTMQAKTLRLVQQDMAAGGTEGPGSPEAASPSPEEPQAAQQEPGHPAEQEAGSATPIRDRMRRKLARALQPSSLEIIDESHRHASHADRMLQPGTADASGETHFRVEVVSEAFEGMNTVKRHRTVFNLLDEELRDSVHALSLVTKTAAEAAA